MPVARSTSSPRPTREQETIAPLAAWTAVFPLSHGPAHRVRLHTGPNADADLVAAITADYLRELSERVPDGCRISADGDLLGPPDLDGAPHDVLFAAVFTTDLDAIARRRSTTE